VQVFGGIIESCGWGDKKKRILSVIKKKPARLTEDAKKKDVLWFATCFFGEVVDMGSRSSGVVQFEYPGTVPQLVLLVQL